MFIVTANPEFVAATDDAHTSFAIVLAPSDPGWLIPDIFWLQIYCPSFEYTEINAFFLSVDEISVPFFLECVNVLNLSFLSPFKYKSLLK